MKATWHSHEVNEPVFLLESADVKNRYLNTYEPFEVHAKGEWIFRGVEGRGK